MLKRLANVAVSVALAPAAAAYRLESAVYPESRREPLFQAWSQVLSAIPGLTGQFVRRGFYGHVLPECHEHSCIGWGTVFSSRDVRIGEGVYVGARCMLGRVTLERHVTIGSNVDVLSGKRQHNFDDPDHPIQEQGGVYERVTIGENSWIGNGAIVMANVGRRSIVAAGSVVVQPVPDGAIVAGNPARVIRRREVVHSITDGDDGATVRSRS
jgi:acetyltransferase-like isoleucine patch superfamily enzyme